MSKEEDANITTQEHSQNPLSENEKISFNDLNENENVANVLNTPVPIVTSSEQLSNKEENNKIPSKLIEQLKKMFSPVTNQFLKIGTNFLNKLKYYLSHNYLLLI